MNDKELAEAVVAILANDPDFDDLKQYTFDQFATDWRVAGALMEKVESCYPEKLIDGQWQVQAIMDAMRTEWITTESLPSPIH